MIIYPVTMVRMGSSGPVGLMINQNSMFTMLTSQTACNTPYSSTSVVAEKSYLTTYHVKVKAITEHELPEIARLRLV